MSWKDFIWEPQEEKDALESYDKGETLKEIEKRTGKSYYLLRKLLVSHGRKILSGQTPTRQSNRKHHFNINFFESIDSEEKAYWLGFLCADVHVWHGIAVQLCLAIRDQGHLEKFKAALGLTAAIRQKISEVSICVAVQACSTKMASDLAKHGCVHPSLSRTAPADLPADLERHYLRGLFDGDGCIRPTLNYKKRIWTAGICGTLDCVTRFADFARKLTGSRAKVSGPIRKIYYFTLSGVDMAMLLVEELYRDSTVYLDRKYQLYQECRKEFWPVHRRN